ncbi:MULTISPECIES: DUF6480 family protein [unclassified Streptomyces]|uniref:DUF6480 family protein n=1 Tax=Streptomyces sp. R33 TaxID=3238629 RepID=A0AB39YG29_9ACTN|nr:MULTISPECIES: DUF6480 family protein [unclassified Streptomyces]TDU80352.1 hypothetical protein EDD91_7190 [Streptomyces sp. KS 21]THA39723.1 hypothetical protein E6W17_08945 [Streptomyces sp. A1547]
MSASHPASGPEPRLWTPPGARGSRAGVPPGETPPGESSTGSGAGPYRPLSRGWAMAPLLAICFVALVVALFFLTYAITLMT